MQICRKDTLKLLEQSDDILPIEHLSREVVDRYRFHPLATESLAVVRLITSMTSPSTSCDVPTGQPYRFPLG